MDKIVLVKTSAIGDVIQTFPVLEYLRTRFPKATIDWVVEETIAPLLHAHPLLSNVLTIRSAQWKRQWFLKNTYHDIRSCQKTLQHCSYDTLFDLQGNTKSALVTQSIHANQKIGFDWHSVREKSNLLATNLRFFVPDTSNIRLKYLQLVQRYYNDPTLFSPQGVRLTLSLEEKEKKEELLDQHLTGFKWMICFGSRWRNKQLDIHTWHHLLHAIFQSIPSQFLFIFSTQEEERIARMLASQFPDHASCIGNLSLPLWQALMWEMHGVLTVDSAALHLCGTTTTPSFSFFGPSRATSYIPLGATHGSVQGACPYHNYTASRCPCLRTCTTGACLRHLTPEELFIHFQQWFQRIYTCTQ